jgi:hypothetical protein
LTFWIDFWSTGNLLFNFSRFLKCTQCFWCRFLLLEVLVGKIVIYVMFLSRHPINTIFKILKYQSES